MLKIIIAFLNYFGFKSWAAALEGGSQAYQNQQTQEQIQGQKKLQALVDQTNQEVANAQAAAHAEVVNSPDPDATVNQQLCDIYATGGDFDADTR